MVTTNELKQILNLHISKLVWKEGNSNSGFKIHVTKQYYIKAKYSCTEDEKEFSFVKGRVYYKGFELSW